MLGMVFGGVVWFVEFRVTCDAAYLPLYRVMVCSRGVDSLSLSPVHAVFAIEVSGAGRELTLTPAGESRSEPFAWLGSVRLDWCVSTRSNTRLGCLAMSMVARSVQIFVMECAESLWSVLDGASCGTRVAPVVLGAVSSLVPSGTL